MTRGDSPDDPGRAALLFHTLSSFGWYDEPVVVSGTVLGSMPPTESPDGALSSFASLLLGRSSQREFTGESVTEDELLAVAWCGYGLSTAPGPARRATVPSAGGLLALRLVILPLTVAGVDRRLHEFQPESLTLGSLSSPMPDRPAAWFRTRHISYDKAAAVIVLSVDLGPPTRRYGERGYRYALLEAGHSGQNICLAAAALGLGAVPVGGFDDDLVNQGLREDLGDSVAVYAVALGRVGLPADPAAASSLVRQLRVRHGFQQLDA